MPPAATLPNAAFVDDPGQVSDKRLDSLHFPVSGSGVQLLFEHNFNLEASDAMLDVARHFFSVADVKRYIDLLALYKFNRLHLHLTDDQGFRLDVRAPCAHAARSHL